MYIFSLSLAEISLTCQDYYLLRVKRHIADGKIMYLLSRVHTASALGQRVMKDPSPYELKPTETIKATDSCDRLSATSKKS